MNENLSDFMNGLEGASESYINYTNEFFFGASFVCEKNSLTHWERYGDKCEGVCIALKLNKLDDFILENQIFNAVFISHREILYNFAIQKEQFKVMFVSNILQIIKNILPLLSKKSAIMSDEWHELGKSIYTNFLKTMRPVCKHEGFQDEKEHRLIFNETALKNDIKTYKDFYRRDKIGHLVFKEISNNIECVSKILKLDPMNKKTDLVGNYIRSYYALYLGEIWSSELIPEIMIGPKCYQNPKELRLFLKMNGLKKTKVGISKIPIR